MHVDAESRKAELSHLNEQDGPAFKIKNDPRITSVGRFLRATSIDELPQLFNVLMGEMSLVGPRPPTFDEVAKYRRWYLRRLDVTPGLTCIWQVKGRSRVSFEEWMRMDLEYIDQQSFWLDLELIVKTVPALLLRRGF
jgi:lipopolysaccharide/colanic/teichoic acid biosynthesis glycosyltransferase